MSTFCGIFKEMPNVSADNFTGNNLKSSCFFLSHCHTDHMKGLLDRPFTELLKDRSDVFLYCSSISKLILETLLPALMDKIKVLPSFSVVKVPGTENFSTPYEITVSSVPAGHCPGSLMFVMETAQKTVLYTGDFRITLGDIKKYRQFYNGDYLKLFDSIYLDSTFFSELFWDFPSRSDSIKVIIDSIKEWLDCNNENIVEIQTTAKYGGEVIIMDVSKALKTRVHVPQWMYDMYSKVPDVFPALTTDCSSTRIHSDFRFQNSCLAQNKGNVLTIRPCAQSFRCDKSSKPTLSLQHSKNFIRVNYSSHSSCSEIVDFLNFLKPKAMYCCTDVCASKNPKILSGQALFEDLRFSWKTGEDKAIGKKEELFPSSKVAYNSKAARIVLIPDSQSNSIDELELPPILSGQAFEDLKFSCKTDSKEDKANGKKEELVPSPKVAHNSKAVRIVLIPDNQSNSIDELELSPVSKRKCHSN